ncbi:bifunctional SulP family inorganic anion transporter/carbonic anhydrase [Singulisphaera acidiphila]|uniref:Sulfate permease-like transporter, MFS superfamily n=1 Tax=Singulisphaera acidiphila (strain ATCC BAA-1392 / DSM 18658 / VKM B-2454 / MOB10) TaxID=886293 RepID=L0DED6_SINAD|nr:SulP family inorganic anion transporter [Singulisphaera acidiphila]AGA27617.1 sulfate permease-like transporter, MFS superfamily [Singulisphaera acidiphila DSM 18658]
MTPNPDLSRPALTRDLTAGLVVFLVALPLCLGIALASNAPLLSGVLAGIVGGILVGMLSGSQNSVSGPAAGLTAVVAAQIVSLGSFQTFLLALVIAGLIQIALGIAQAGFLAAFFPSSVIKGLLTAIGVILILKQIPHVLGHDHDPEGNMAFFQRNHENSFSALGELLGNIHPGAAVIGLVSVALLVVWDKWERLKKSDLPIALVVVILGIGLNLLFRQFGGRWVIGANHLVQVPVAESLAEFRQYLQHPDFSQWLNPAVYVAALTLAAVASLEALLNLEAVDKLDPQQRTTPPSRELWAQGVGNVVSGLVGGLPVTLVVVRSSLGLNAGSKTRLTTIVQGVLLLLSVTILPAWLNLIPLSCLAAILLVTGVKLASPALFRKMWNEGRYQFLPFLLTVVSIVLTDLLTGILIGLAVSTAFILGSNVRRPLRRTVEKHMGGEVIRIKLATQVSFLNRAALSQALNEVPRGGQILLDAHNTEYIDPDVLSLIRDFKEQTAPARGVEVSLRGFRTKYELQDQTQYVDHSSRQIQSSVTPQQVLELLKAGHERFRTGQRLTRDLTSQVIATASGQHPLAVVVSCIDSRTPAELLFDLGVGDVFSVRVAGNITSRKVMGSVEYGCAVAGAKLILVLGHTRCGAVTAAVNFACTPETAASSTGCEHIEFILRDIQKSIDPLACQNLASLSPSEKEAFVNDVARRNVGRVVEEILQESPTLNGLVRDGRLAIVGTIYDVATGNLEFLPIAERSDERVPDVV